MKSILLSFKNIFLKKIIVFISIFFLNKIVLSNTSFDKIYLDQFEINNSILYGQVFNDLNNNGIQDKTEEGIAGIRLITSSGFEMITDENGRYLLEQNSRHPSANGIHLVIFLDTHSLLQDQILTTHNPLVKRLTGNTPVQFNFGVRKKDSRVELQNSSPSQLQLNAISTKAATPNTIFLSNNQEQVSARSSPDAELLALPLATDKLNQVIALNNKNRSYIIKADGLFYFGRSDIAGIIPPGTEVLKTFVRDIQTEFQSIELVQLKAHTDRIGSDEKNLALSYQRAELIKNLLIEFGLKTASFELSGVGAGEPIVVCKGGNIQTTIQCLAPNRRFEIQVTGVPFAEKGPTK